MSAVRDILGAQPKVITVDGKAAPKAKQKPQGKKIPRELAGLLHGDIGSHVKDAMASVKKEESEELTMQQKVRKLKTTKLQNKWTQGKINLASTRPGLHLRHWCKEGEVGKEYVFAKFNKTCADALSYSDEMRDKHLKDLDSGWSRFETDLLFALCRRFDLRFQVVHDRYTDPRTPPHTLVELPPKSAAKAQQHGLDASRHYLKTKRSLEDLKRRYFAVAKKVLEAECHAKVKEAKTAGDAKLQSKLQEALKSNPIVAKEYDYERDCQRKQQLGRQVVATEDMKAKEKELQERSRKLQQDIAVGEGQRKKQQELNKKLQKLIAESEADQIHLTRPDEAMRPGTHWAYSMSQLGGMQPKSQERINAVLVGPCKLEMETDELSGRCNFPNPCTLNTVRAYNALRCDIATMFNLHGKLTREYQKALIESPDIAATLPPPGPIRLGGFAGSSAASQAGGAAASGASHAPMSGRKPPAHPPNASPPHSSDAASSHW